MTKAGLNLPTCNPDKGALAQLGAQIGKRLAGNALVYKLPTEQAEIFALGEFMDAEECARMRDMIDAVAKPSKAFEADYSQAYRTSYSGDVDPWDPFVLKIQRRIDDLLGIPSEYGETIQGQRYLTGQEFKSHCDWFPSDTPYWDDEAKRGGQRGYTAMVYLNQVEEGGETCFPNLGFTIDPKPGVLLMWNNAAPDGAPNTATLHTAKPVVKGVKYVITKWYRTRKWS